MSDNATKTYTVHAKRWTRGWELYINGIGVTQSRSLGDAEAMARDYIALDRDIPPESFTVKIVPEVGGGLDTDIREAREIVTKAADMQQSAAERSRRVARRLKAEGLTGRDIARVLGVSPQRVSQLLSSSTE
jgi:DNA-directed RNA polymerase specialized sigma24 family protein